MDNEFVNSYIENTTSILHEFLGNILHLKTQMSLLEKASAVKDEENKKLRAYISELESVRSNVAELGEKSNNLQRERDEYLNALQEKLREVESWKQKASHVDNCMNQISEMNKQLASKQQELDAARQSFESLEKEVTSYVEMIKFRDDVISSYEKKMKEAIADKALLQEQVTELTTPKKRTRKKVEPAPEGKDDF